MSDDQEKHASNNGNGLVQPFGGSKTGRPKGSKNKFTDLKNAFLEAFYSEQIGGTEGLVEWACKNNENKTHFYKFIVQLLPKDLKLSGNADTPIATKVEIIVQNGNVDPDLENDEENTYETELTDEEVKEVAHNVIDPALESVKS